MGGVVLLTGGTGFLGAQIARRVIATADRHLIMLVHASDAESAMRAMRRAFWDWPELRDAVGDRISAVPGDVTKPRLGLEAGDHARLVRHVTHIIHAAADIRLAAPSEVLRPANVDGTANVIELALAVHADHGLQRMSHVSTAYVAGRRTGVILEEPPTGDGGFTNGYEETKFEAERLVHDVSGRLPVSIFRPAMVVGDSRTGAILTFNTFYSPIKRYFMNGERLVPASPGQRINIVPVDYVAEAIARLTFDPGAAGVTFHLTAPHESLPTVDDLLEEVRGWEERELRVRAPRPVEVPFSVGATVLKRTEPRLAALLPYFHEQRDFRRDNVDRLLGEYTLEWRRYLPRLLEFAVSRAFMHGSGRTVHEQIVFRLGAHAGPVTFRDIARGQTAVRPAHEVRREMLDAAAAMRAMGVRKGDRVAIIGLNSTRYLSLDVAIGLCGAVSVPLYYTSPPAEIDTLVASSRARLLFVGAPAILTRLSELASTVPVVSFCRDPHPDLPDRYVMDWDDFISRGAGGGECATAPVDLGDVATLRFTSGTTGAPKGTVFTHGQLRWMAQTVVTLLPWTTRKGDNRYLSFLPMNHVVEGILGSYAAYDLPGAEEINFLEDFRTLATALRKVRPTIFFGVPRLYEKAWAQLSASRLGRLMMALPDAVKRHVVRAMLLHRMGLDRCAQLLVGSAPMGEGLLSAYRRAGIEIHDAYGMTEAPLVSLNRLGRNRISTVGEPLPETEVGIAPDGEILVRGPQVSCGYDDPAIPSPVERGWLHTGDLGRLTDEGFLIVDGRRKEMIATSYAKKVSPEKVEVLLRAIPGVAEALLVGDQRPYCTALLWVDKAILEREDALSAIDRAVRQAGQQLSPPERPRRWAILGNDLSVERGDLTASFKPKRAIILRRYSLVVESLYGAGKGRNAEHVADIDGDLTRREQDAVRS